MTQRVATVVYTAKILLPDGYRDAFELSLQLPDTPGETIEFPTIQKCEKGQTGWVEIPEEGQDPFSLEHPAPFVTITGDDEGTDSSQPAAAGTTDDDGDDADDGDGSNTLGEIGLVAGLLGLVLSGAAFVQVRRRA